MKVFTAKRTRGRSPGQRSAQEGTVLLVVIMLVVMFTGLGLLAMRHTHGEMRSAGAYADAQQAAVLAESGLSILTTDIKLGFRAPDAGEGCDKKSYKAALDEWFASPDNTGAARLPLSVQLDEQCESTSARQIPDPRLNGTQPLGTAPALGAGYSDVALEIVAEPLRAAACPGFTNNTDIIKNYRFEVRSRASFGPAQEGRIPKGRATARASFVLCAAE